ncbi:hypothetical protein OC846_005898 [Tilletia horrida]|uniref:Uncharacterized protein n=1 Tax=Tilletia horrida TaxID=155126 RepID=A0AAN6GJX8_9BASI|nr:hypothetical protein OC846_005898 [Tilletia horrida]KAK0560969.1 hypothetical protein OC861_006040 [Tilletia horrida]
MPRSLQTCTATSQVLGTPELLGLILSWLIPDRGDLLACILVSKTFQATAQPLLLRHLNLAVGGIMKFLKRGNGNHQTVRDIIQSCKYSLLSLFASNHGFGDAPIWSFRLYDEFVQTAYTEGGTAGVWRANSSWHVDQYRVFQFPGPSRDAVHEFEDLRWVSARTLLYGVMVHSKRRPNVELSFGIISSQNIVKVLDHVPEAAQCVSAIHIECDAVRLNGSTAHVITGREAATLRGMNRYFPDWVEAATRVVERICKTQRNARVSVFKDFRITTNAGSSGPSTPPARLEDVKQMMNSIHDFVEELWLQLNPLQFEAETVDHILSRTFPRLRKFSFRLPASPQHTPTADTLTGFLARHPLLEHIDISVEGVIPTLGRLRLKRLRSLSLCEVDNDQLDSFLACHRHLIKLSVQKVKFPDRFDLPALDIDSLDHIKEWIIDHRILKRLMVKHPSIKMATPIGLSTLSDLIDVPELPIQERVPMSGITYLHIYITNEPWLQVLAQLASSFDYRSYPNLAELRLALNVGNSPAEAAIKANTRGANECLHSVIVSLTSAYHLRILHLNLRGASELSLGGDDDKILHSHPPALKYVTWQVLNKGYTQTYRVLKKSWREGRWTSAYLKLTSHDHLPAGQSTWSPYQPTPLLDHYGTRGDQYAEPTLVF